jgi:hypothetical protein
MLFNPDFKTIFAGIVLSISTFTCVNAQTKDVSLDIISNTPRRITSLTVGYKYGGNSDSPLIFSHNIDLNFNATKFNLNVNYEWPIKFIYDKDDAELAKVENLFNKIEVAAGFGLWTSVKNEYIEVKWSGGYGHEWVTDVPVTALKVKGIHTGFTSKKSYLGIDKMYYEYNSNSVFFGYFWSKYSNYEFRVEGRYKSGFRYHISYIDLFYAPPISQPLADMTEYLPYGVRLGSHVYSLRHIGSSFRIEFGALPKNYVKSSGGKDIALMYFKFGIGINGTLRKQGKVIEKYK